MKAKNAFFFRLVLVIFDFLYKSIYEYFFNGFRRIISKFGIVIHDISFFCRFSYKLLQKQQNFVIFSIIIWVLSAFSRKKCNIFMNFPSMQVVFLKSDNCNNQGIIIGRSYENTDIDISHCCFLHMSHFSGNGGVILVSTSFLSMSIYDSMFHNCSCFNQGGAIYFNSSLSKIRMVCASRCNGSWYHFALISASQDNKIDFLSLTLCSINANGYFTIEINSGYQTVSNTNSSLNQGYRGTGIRVLNPNSYLSHHCTFSNNVVSNAMCVNFVGGSGKMSFSNIIHNNSPASLGVVTIGGFGIYNMEFCIFDFNQNTLFYVATGNISIFSSYIKHDGITSSINNNSLTRFNSYSLEFYGSNYCHAEHSITIPIITYQITRNCRFFVTFLLYLIN